MSLKSIHKLEIWKANTLYSLNSGLPTKPELKSGHKQENLESIKFSNQCVCKCLDS